MRIFDDCDNCGIEYQKIGKPHILHVAFFNSYNWERSLKSFCSEKCRTKYLHKLVDNVRITKIEVLPDDFRKKEEGLTDEAVRAAPQN